MEVAFCHIAICCDLVTVMYMSIRKIKNVYFVKMNCHFIQVCLNSVENLYNKNTCTQKAPTVDVKRQPGLVMNLGSFTVVPLLSLAAFVITVQRLQYIIFY